MLGAVSSFWIVICNDPDCNPGIGFSVLIELGAIEGKYYSSIITSQFQVLS